MAVKLITSAAYVDSELAAEFGRLPPAFLPVGHKRLYEEQIAVLSPLEGPCYMSLPESFAVPGADEARLAQANVVLVRVPDALRLAESVLYALERIGVEKGPLHILHGDTLIYALPDAQDVAAVGAKPEVYSWGAIDEGARLDMPIAEAARQRTTLAGYFCFSNIAELKQSLARSQGDFVRAIRLYRKAQGLKAWDVPTWLDFGHLQTFYRSRCSIRTQRAFNDMNVSFVTVEKSSVDTAKITAEADWFETIPPRLRLYTPAFLGRISCHGRPGYALEYLPLPTLHELFVFSELGWAVWAKILQSCTRFLDACRSEAVPADLVFSPLKALTIEKTLARLKAFEVKAGLETTQPWKFAGRHLPSLRKIAELTAEAIDFTGAQQLGIMHGDLCFTNVLFDFRTSRIRVIDPRGSFQANAPSPYGDLRYDVAKLNHSISGGYDYILAGRYACSGFEDRDVNLTFPQESAASWLPAQAAQLCFAGTKLSDPEITAITVHLFLSMLALHDDRPDRQKAFVASALRMFSQLDAA